MATGFGSALRRLREGEERPATWVARKLDVAPATVLNWESERTTPSGDDLRRLFDLFGVTNARRAEITVLPVVTQ